MRSPTLTSQGTPPHLRSPSFQDPAHDTSGAPLRTHLPPGGHPGTPLPHASLLSKTMGAFTLWSHPIISGPDVPPPRPHPPRRAPLLYLQTRPIGRPHPPGSDSACHSRLLRCPLPRSHSPHPRPSPTPRLTLFLPFPPCRPQPTDRPWEGWPPPAGSPLCLGLGSQEVTRAPREEPGRRRGGGGAGGGTERRRQRRRRERAGPPRLLHGPKGRRRLGDPGRARDEGASAPDPAMRRSSLGSGRWQPRGPGPRTPPR